jgi:hypothetical protein
MRTLLIASAALGVCAATPAPAEAQDSTVFDIEMLFQYDRLTPDFFPGINNRVRLTVTLSGRNAVRVDRYRRIGPFSEASGGTGTLGQGAPRGSWRVVDANTIEGRQDFPRSVRTTTLTVTGGNSCAVRTVDRLKPGFREYMFRRVDSGTMALFTEPRLVSSHCTIR